MKKQSAIVILLTLFLIFNASCIRQINQMKRFGDCEFKYITTDSVVLAGVPMSKYSLMDNLSLVNVRNILGLFAKGEAPLKFKVFMQANNNKSSKAAINQMDWQFYIEDKKVLEGKNTERIEVSGHDSTVFAIDMEMDLVQTLRIDNLNSLLNLAYNLLDVKKVGKSGVKPLHIKLMVRPSFKIGKKVHQYPRYITIIKDYEMDNK